MNDEAQVAPGDDPAVAPSSGRPEKASRKSLLLRLDPAVHEALAKWAAAGCEVSLLICTDGSKGTWDPSADLAALVGATFAAIGR